MNGAPPIRASELRTPFTIHVRGSSQDATGQEVPTYTPSASPAWGRLLAGRGAEVNEARGIVAVATYRIRLRYRAGLSVRDRLSSGSRTWEIVSLLDPDGHRAILEIEAVEVAP